MATMVQLVSLLYKDRPVENILAMLDVKKCANLASTSESSFDNEEDQYGKIESLYWPKKLLYFVFQPTRCR